MNSPRVLVAGAINTDLVARTLRAPGPGETVTGSSFAIFGGGKGANQAVAAARAGADTSLLGAVGDDAFGTERRVHLAADGIDLESVATISGVASGVALISVEPSGQNRILYVPGATLQAQAHHAREAVVRVRPSVVLMTLELPPETLAALVTEVKGLGATIALNATPEPELARRFLPDTDMLVVNEPEASALVGHTVTLESSAVAAEALRGMGSGTVIITLGEQGAVAV
ncbi:MAG TPA: PfkB family carbohydrate kinase, partial [Thermomicrobiales bacterium]|nr:PfkB family carbohydrate kinase [Thermomicrobiales bacterium]